MTQVEKIKKDIQEMETALSMPSINDMPKVKKRLETDLETAKQQLKSLQKKSDPQPTGKVEQLPQKPELEEWAKQIETEAQKPRPSVQLRSEPRQQEMQPGLLEQVIKFVVPPPPPEQIIELEFEIGGKKVVENYEIMDLKDKAKTWFTQTAEGAAIQGKGNLEKSIQYRRLRALIPSWESLYGFKPTAQDLHRNHNKHGDAVKKAAILLLQILTA